MIRRIGIVALVLAAVMSPTASAGAQDAKSDKSVSTRLAALEAAVARLEGALGTLKATIDALAQSVSSVRDAQDAEAAARAEGDRTTLGNATEYTDRATALLGVRFVFATSQEVPSNLGGLAGADTVCQTLASAAGLAGRYAAWLSDDTGSPSTRFTRSAADYRLVDGTLVAHGWSDLTDGRLAMRIALDERGNAAGDFVWTNTNESGTPASAESCENWSSTNQMFGAVVGSTVTSDGHWTVSGFRGVCSSNFPRRLYCFQQ